MIDVLKTMKLYRTTNGFLVEQTNQFFPVQSPNWDHLIARDDLNEHLDRIIQNSKPVAVPGSDDLLPPIGSQDVWAAGVTYYRSRNARMEESKSAGGGDFYDRVYAAERPELFFKSTPQRVIGPLWQSCHP